MRPLVIVLAFFLLIALAACQSGPGPSATIDARPALGAGVRVFAGPHEGVGAAARLELGQYGFRTGKAAEPGPSVIPTTTAPCPEHPSTARPDPGCPEGPAPDEPRAP